MSEIPGDLKTAAYALVDKVKAEDHGFELSAYEFAIAAMWAERQRCAGVADKEAAGYKANGFPQAALGCITTRKAILAAT